MPAAGRSAPELIAAKTRVPEARPELIERDRLIEPLVGGAGPIVAIEAPAGYGKSTLLEQWAIRESCPVAFVRLDQADSDPVVFWRYVVAALKTIEPDLVADVELELQGAAPLVEDVAVPRLLNALEGHDGRIVIMLDDFHRLEARSLAPSLDVATRHLPKSLTVALATRPGSGVRLADLRARGLVYDIDAIDLRLTMDEAIEAVSRFDPSRGRGEARSIYLQTEGWATGVYLASRTGAHVRDARPSEQIQRYLVEEMLEGLDPDDRRFMQQTSVLDELDPDLCDSVVGSGESAERLHRLSATNLMLVPTGREGVVRYHHLLQEALQAELDRSHGRDDICVLHRRASQWKLAHGRLSEAISHAILAGTTSEAVELVCRNWYEFLLTGNCSTAQRWIGWFDETDFTAHPPLAVAAAHISAFAGDADAVEQCVRLSERLEYGGDPLDGSTSFRSSVAIMRAFIGLDGVAAAMRDAEYALGVEPADSPWRPSLEAIDGMCRLMQADDQTLDETLVLAKSTMTGPLGLATYALGILALVNAWRGRWGTADVSAREAIRLIEELRIGDLVTSGLPYAIAAIVASRQDQDAAAAGLLRKAEQALEHRGGGFIFDTLLLRLTVAEAQLERGLPEAASEQLELAKRDLARIGDGGRAEFRLNRLTRRVERERHRSTIDPATASVLLSARELQVLSLLGRGLTLEQIGDQLFISRDTVKTHTSRVYRKLGVHGRQEAVTSAERLGIIRGQ